MRTATRAPVGAVLLIAIAIAIAPAANALPGTRQLLVPPVDAPMGRAFDAPETAYAPGHRGIDYKVAAGTPIRAAPPGRVTFAGPVAGELAITLQHAGGVQTTYSLLGEVRVTAGREVGQGRYIGTVGRAHSGVSGLHFGVKVAGEYVDPTQYLGPLDAEGAIHLAPLTESLADDIPYELSLVHDGAATAARACRDPMPMRSRPPAPTSNVAVAVAGIGSASSPDSGTELFNPEYGPGSLGYPDDLIYRFSYAGVDGRRLHAPYGARATYGDLKKAASRLIYLLRRIHDRHPDRAVDLFAHSQGGIVARTALERMAGSFDPRLPHVANLVTYASPHEGAPLAGAVGKLESDTLVGGWLVDRAGDLARAGAPFPDPQGGSVEQISPGSALLDALAREDVTFGTRVLALAMPHDLVVPADKALYDGKDSRVLPPEGLNGHEAVVRSDAARGHVHAFLRGAPRACMSDWQEPGRLIGKGLGLAASFPVTALEGFESVVVKRAVAAARGAKILGTRGARWVGGRAGDAAELIASAWSSLW